MRVVSQKADVAAKLVQLPELRPTLSARILQERWAGAENSSRKQKRADVFGPRSAPKNQGCQLVFAILARAVQPPLLQVGFYHSSNLGGYYKSNHVQLEFPSREYMCS